ncbi:MAG: aspartate/glutamate racemase family protein [Phyllobacterium sp.]|uniref:aspartate/glutamate racemase family protein n=1 Tax=Phyllobacterium sp. TaxID=1871046 RepID=UPI0030F19EBB
MLERDNPRLLIVNGNTNAVLTERLREKARAILPSGRQITALTARFGAEYISDRESAAVAAHAIMETVKGHLLEVGPQNYDACLLACFGEPGIGAAKEVFDFPVVGMAEASIVSALQLGERFAIVTIGERWPGMLRELMRQQSLQERCCGMNSIPGKALDLAARPEDARNAVRVLVKRAIVEEGADVVIIGGAALAGIAQSLQPEWDAPLVCSFHAGLLQAEAMAGLRRPAQQRSEKSEYH